MNRAVLSGSFLESEQACRPCSFPKHAFGPRMLFTSFQPSSALFVEVVGIVLDTKDMKGKKECVLDQLVLALMFVFHSYCNVDYVKSKGESKVAFYCISAIISSMAL